MSLLSVFQFAKLIVPYRRTKPETVTLLTILLQITQVRKPLEFLRICGLFVAGAEGFEPSAYGFGDRRSTS